MLEEGVMGKNGWLGTIDSSLGGRRSTIAEGREKELQERRTPSPKSIHLMSVLFSEKFASYFIVDDSFLSTRSFTLSAHPSYLCVAAAHTFNLLTFSHSYTAFCF